MINISEKLNESINLIERNKFKCWPIYLPILFNAQKIQVVASKSQILNLIL